MCGKREGRPRAPLRTLCDVDPCRCTEQRQVASHAQQAVALRGALLLESHACLCDDIRAPGLAKRQARSSGVWLRVLDGGLQASCICGLSRGRVPHSAPACPPCAMAGAHGRRCAAVRRGLALGAQIAAAMAKRGAARVGSDSSHRTIAK